MRFFPKCTFNNIFWRRRRRGRQVQDVTKTNTFPEYHHNSHTEYNANNDDETYAGGQNDCRHFSFRVSQDSTRSFASSAENQRMSENCCRGSRYGMEVDENDDDVAVRIQKRKSSNGQARKRKRRVAVIVEDASDSENEDEIMSSYWRNRRPSPGQSWMEPVEHYKKDVEYFQQ